MPHAPCAVQACLVSDALGYNHGIGHQWSDKTTVATHSCWPCVLWCPVTLHMAAWLAYVAFIGTQKKGSPLSLLFKGSLGLSVRSMKRLGKAPPTLRSTVLSAASCGLAKRCRSASKRPYSWPFETFASHQKLRKMVRQQQMPRKSVLDGACHEP